MTIVFVAGTTAELIKVAPVMTALREAGRPFQLWSTSQHTTGVEESLGDLDVPQPDRFLIAPDKRVHIARSGQVPVWVLRLVASVVKSRAQLKAQLSSDGRPGVIVVHGDTFSTVFGSLLGRFLGVRVAHVEAGLRSGRLLNPLPEELNRQVVGKLATIHFAPTQREVENLTRAKARGDIVLTGANTVVDALLSIDRSHVDVDLPDQFGLVTLHRFELLRNADDFRAVMQLLAEESKYPLVMVLSHAEKARLAELGLDRLFGPRFTAIDKRPYAKFLPILGRASFVVTDSGGLQEECAALGIPCVVHRERTERHQGLGENVVLTRMDLRVITEFLSTWPDYRREPAPDTESPSHIIARTLMSV